MDKLFGIPMGTLLVVCLAGLAATLVLVGYLALTNRVFFKLGIRKLTRRPGRTALIVVGLMLGTVIITAAFGTGDTMTNTIRSSTLTSLGYVDEVISVHGAGKPNSPDAKGSATNVNYFDQALFANLKATASSLKSVDGIAPVVLDAVAIQDETSRHSEPLS